MLLIIGSQYHSDSAIDLSDFAVVVFPLCLSLTKRSVSVVLSFCTNHPPFSYHCLTLKHTHKLTFSSHTRQLLHGLRLGGAERDGEEKHPAEQSQQHGCSVWQRGQHVEGIYVFHHMLLC